MSLNEEGIKSILDQLTDDELTALASTVTQGLSKSFTNTREGVKYLYFCK